MLPATFLTASVLGLIFVYLSVAVTLQRRRLRVSLGTGPDSVGPGVPPPSAALLVASRTQANFAEYVPISLILLGLVEANGYRADLVYGIGLALVIARLIHPIGMGMAIPNFFRAGGMLIQWLALLTLSVLGLLCTLGKFV